MGWLAMLLPEEFGGFDAGAVEIMLLCEELGRYLVVEPYLETIVVAAGLLQRAASAERAGSYLAELAEGRLQGCLAHREPGRQPSVLNVRTVATATRDGFVLNGHKTVVRNGPAADVLVVSARTSGRPGESEGVSLFAVAADAAGVQRDNYPTWDGREACELRLDGVRVDRDALLGDAGGAASLLDAIGHRALLAGCAEAVGAMSALLEATMDYTRQRQQFGQPLSRFQVLRHRMADMFMHLELTRSLLVAAAWKLDQGADDCGHYLSALKARTVKAGRFVGQNAIQLHGGIAMTEELSAGHYFKRLTALDSWFGSREFHLQRFGDSTAGTLAI